MRFRISVLLILLLGSLNVWSQTPASTGVGRFSGLAAGGLNPSFLSINPLNWDVQLVSTGVLFSNSAISLDATSISSLQRGVKIDVWNESSINKQVQADRFIREQLNGGSHFLFGQTSTSGLGLMFSIGPRWTFGLSNQVHGVFSTVDLGEVTLRHAFEGINYSGYLDSVLTIKDLNINGALWSETNLQASWMFIRNRDWMVSAGVGLKWLNSLGAFRLSIQELQYQVPKEDTLTVNNLDMSYASSIPGPLDNSPLIKSASMGLDLGFSLAAIDEEREKLRAKRIVKRGRTDCYSFSQVFKRYKRKELRPAYRWKVGVALLDIGRLSINQGVLGNEVTNASFGYRNGEKVFGDDISNFDSLLLAKYSENGVIKPIESLSLMLNTRLSIQADVRIGDWAAVGFSWIHRLDNSGLAIKRMNHLALLPRVEWSFLEIGLPLNLYEYQQAGVGVMLRLGPLTVGTDRLGELLGMKNIYGADAYFSLRVFDMF